jgi:DNA-binding MurR/RpiR family transcriptional regulator
VNRFCRRLGFGGYAELRVAIATDNGRAEQANWQQAIGSEVQPGDSLERTAAVIAGGDMLAIQQTVDQLDLGVLATIVDALSTARRIHLYGVSGSALAAAEMRHRLGTIGMPAWAWSDVHDGLGAAASLEPGDVLLAFSHSGRTHETVQVLQTAAASGAITVAITNSTGSPLATASDYCLLTAVNEGSLFRSQALAARHSQLFLVDLIFVAVANHNFDRSLSTFEKVAHAVQPHLVDHRRR